MRALRQLLLVSLLVSFSNGKTKSTTSKLSLGSLSSVDLDGAGFDGDILFDLSWPGSEAKQQALQSNMDGEGNARDSEVGVAKVLPSTLVSESYSASETVTMTTVDDERYTCLLPDLSGESSSKEIEEGIADVAPQRLLEALNGYCTRLLMGYWSYELCHSRYVRQYHEEQVEKGKFKVDEYFLGKEKVSENAEQVNENEKDVGEEDAEKPPVFYYNGKSYAFHEVEMDQGTLCDISNEPRSISIKYICDMDAHQSGTLLHIAEVTTCKYEAIVSTKNLCNNKHFRLKENPRHAINCYPEGDAPRRPTVLLEHELSLNQFYPKSSKDNKQGEQYGGDYRLDPQESFEKQISKGLPPDEQFLASFLSGESCLRGGAGWWLHEICYGKYVRQVHEDNRGRTDVYLGYWNEAEHRAWFERTGSRKQSKTQVTHLYTKGDLCDVTGTPRTCQVKFKCVKTTKASQVTIFLEEPTTCSYTLTVEASFLCPLLEKTNEIGLILLSEAAPLQAEAPIDAPPTGAPPTSDVHTESPPSQVEHTRSLNDESEKEHIRHSHSHSNEPHSDSNNPHSQSSDFQGKRNEKSTDSLSNSRKSHSPNHETRESDSADSASKHPRQHPRRPILRPAPPLVLKKQTHNPDTKDVSKPQSQSRNDVEESRETSARIETERSDVADNTFGESEEDFEDDERSNSRLTSKRKDAASHA